MVANIGAIAKQGMTTNENLITQQENLANADMNLEYPTPNDLNFEVIAYQNFDKNESGTFSFSITKNIFLMHFLFDGKTIYAQENSENKLTFKNIAYNIFYIPKGIFTVSTSVAKTSFLNIYIDEDFLKRQMPKNQMAIDSEKSNSILTLFSKNLSINPKLKNVINEITNCEFDGHLKMLYMKAKVIELFTLQMAHHAEKKSVALKQDQIEKMLKVKLLIETNINESYSLAYLARAAGTNEQYLKKHFKTLFGHTVFGYMLAFKMQKAKDMLLNDQHKIAEIAEVVGYRHATHFTNAFKKFFGYLPRVLKTKVLWGGYFTFNFEIEFLELLIVF